MKLNQFLTTTLVATVIAFTSTAAYATEPTNIPSNEQQELQRLEEMAGRPTKYIEDTSPSSQPTTYAYRDSGCTLHPEQVHLRKSGNFQMAGAKPYTQCNHVVNRISHSSKLYIVEWAGLRYKEMTHQTQAASNIQKMQMKNLAWQCKNDHNSVFQQITEGTVTTNGQTFRTTAQTIKSTLQCGY